MDKKKLQAIAVKIIVTFLEAALAAWAVYGYHFNKLALAGAVGAGASAVYNFAVHYAKTPQS